MGYAVSELKNWESCTIVHKGILLSIKGQSQAKNSKQENEQNMNVFLCYRGQFMADFSHV